MSFLGPAKGRCTSKNVPTCTYAAEPRLEVAGIEQTEAPLRKATTALFMYRDQAKHGIRHAP